MSYFAVDCVLALIRGWVIGVIASVFGDVGTSKTKLACGRVRL